jgi:dCTP deaminase
MDQNGYVMKPGDFILGWTAETLELPLHSRLAARVEGKSSLARCAIAIHVSAPTIHAGFEGQIQLEICNIGPLHVRLIPGMAVCQLVFEQTLGTPAKGYRGQFSGQEAG